MSPYEAAHRHAAMIAKYISSLLQDCQQVCFLPWKFVDAGANPLLLWFARLPARAWSLAVDKLYYAFQDTPFKSLRLSDVANFCN